MPDASRLAYLRGPAHTVTEEMIADLWRSAVDNPASSTATVNNIYIHVPFCKSICSFRNYERLRPSNPDFLRAFLDRIKRSISVLGPAVKGLNWGAVYVGGGTPSTLPAAMLDWLFTCLNECFEIHPDAERSFELDPAVISGARLDVLDAIPVAAAAWSEQELTQIDALEFRLKTQTRAERTRSLMWLVPDEHLEYEIARRQQLDTTGAGVEWLGEALALGTPLTGQCQYAGVWEGRVIILTANMSRMVFRVAPGLEENAELRLVLESTPPKDAIERTALTRAMRQVRGVFRLAQSRRGHST